MDIGQIDTGCLPLWLWVAEHSFLWLWCPEESGWEPALTFANLSIPDRPLEGGATGLGSHLSRDFSLQMLAY